MSEDKLMEHYRGHKIYQLHTGKSYYCAGICVNQYRRTIKGVRRDIDMKIYIKKTSKEKS